MMLSIAIDPYGTPHPDYRTDAPRFAVLVREVRTDVPPEWTHELLVIDRKYQDSEGFPIDSVAAGASWAEAFAAAGEFIDRALASDSCVF